MEEDKNNWDNNYSQEQQTTEDKNHQSYLDDYSPTNQEDPQSGQMGKLKLQKRNEKYLQELAQKRLLKLGKNDEK